VTGSHRRWIRNVSVFALFVFLAALYTRPLLERRNSHILSDPYDPILNTSILWWNATTLPFSSAWWSPPFFHPSRDVSAFTENLVGIGPVSTPVYWLTGNPLATHNVTMFLTWPLSAFAVFLLVAFLTRRGDAALLAGLSYGFSPYRTASLAHVQTLSSYWIVFALLGLHGYLVERRARWLVLFGVAWLLQSLSNGYLMLFGSVLVACWLLFFCSTRESWRAVPRVLLAWAIASLPLVPVMLKYRAVLGYNGMRRNLDEPLGLSVAPHAWTEVSDVVWLWGRFLPSEGNNLFPGVTALALVLVAGWLSFRPVRPSEGGTLRRGWRIALVAAVALSVMALITSLVMGRWSVTVGDVVLFRMSNLNRALLVIAVCGSLLVYFTPRVRAAVRRRDPLVFYAAMTVVLAVLACGPVLQGGTDVLVEYAPYRWLMYLPGFNQLRIPSRFWMLGILTLATAAGLAYAALPLRSRSRRGAVFAVAAAGLLLDGWVRALPMADPPELWPVVERAGDSRPILELPIGPNWDAAATYRSMAHRRPVVNGVSGFDPAHYAPLQAGINARDPTMIEALASFGSFDVVVNEAVDPEGGWSEYVSRVDGVTRAGGDGRRALYRVPAFSPPDAGVGDRLQVAGIRAFRHDPGVMIDGRMETEWGDNPQRPDQWVEIDLGALTVVGGLSHALGEYARDFPRLLRVELSADGADWETAWEGPTAALAFRAAALAPREAIIRVAFPARPARYVRLRQLADHVNMWRIAELAVHAPLAR
jgi:hypothetical protein